MVSKVTPLRQNGSFAPSPELIAARMRDLADRIESGDVPVDFVIVVPGRLDSNECMPFIFGRSVTNMECAGLMEFAKFIFMKA